MFQLKVPLSFRSLRPLQSPGGSATAPATRLRPKCGRGLPAGTAAEGVFSQKRPFSWPNYDGRGSQRLELACCQFSSLVSEIAATFEYIDFGGPPNHLQIAKTGGYPTGPGAESRSWAYIISHNADISGVAAREVACYATSYPHNVSQPTHNLPLPVPIRPRPVWAQMHVLRNCVYRQNYYQHLTASLFGYPRGYVAEP